MTEGELREIDAKVAEAMGWENNWDKPGGSDFPYMWGIMDFRDSGPVRAANFPRYSSNIADAWELIEFARTKMIAICVVHVLHSSGMRWEYLAKAEFHDSRELVYDMDESAPLAICKAFLKAMAEK